MPARLFVDRLEVLHTFLGCDFPVHNQLVNSEDVLELPQVNASRLADQRHLGGEARTVIDGDNHRSGHVHEVGIDMECACRSLHVLIKSMGRSADQHQAASELLEVFSAVDDFADLPKHLFFVDPRSPS